MTDTAHMTLTDFLLARIGEDEQDAKVCAEMFPSPWEVADRGWRVRIYAADMPIPDLSSDDEDAMTVRNPVVMEVEPDRHIEDPRWLSERVAHLVRWDPKRVLTECEAKRRIVALHKPVTDGGEWFCDMLETGDESTWPCMTARLLALPYADHPDYRPEWRP